MHFGEVLLVDREKAVISPVIVNDVVHERALLYIKTIILFYYKNILAKNRLVFADNNYPDCIAFLKAGRQLI